MDSKHGNLRKLRVAWYLLQRPSWYPDLWRRLRVNAGRALLPRPIGRSQSVAQKWAASQFVSWEEAFHMLGWQVVHRLREDFPSELAEAERIEAEEAHDPGVGGSSDLVYTVCEAIDARYVVETGVAHGFTTLAILLSVNQRAGHLWSIDMPSPLRRDRREIGMVVPQSLRSAWTLELSPDSVGIPKVLPATPPLDFCHYDSDKSYEGRSMAYPLLWEKLRPGGIFMSDDIADNTAFRDFAAELELSPIVVQAPGGGYSGERFVGLLSKPVE